MSKQEQAALVAWINSFRPSRRITSFENLADGRAFMELLSSIDASHFKSLPTRGPGAGPSSPDNWVLKINALKRIYRLLLSFSLPPPHHSLSTSTLPEPPFQAMVKSPTSPEGTAGLIQLARMVLCVAVWAPGNEKVIAKIQGLGEGHMAELMRGIEEIMGSVPPEEEGEGDHAELMGGMKRLSRRGSPVKRESARPPSPPGALRAERDRLSAENDELRSKCEQMADQVADITASLDEAKLERDDALERLATSRETGTAALRSSQGAGKDAAGLRSELSKAEEIVAKMQEELSQKTAALEEMEIAMAALQEEAAEAAKMKDQLDEYRHVQERLRKSENVIEKYKKKLDDSAAVRRELKNLEEENAQLLSVNNSLEGELRKAGQGRIPGEGHQTKITALESRVAEQSSEIAELSTQLETVRAQLHDTELAHERDKEDLELYREKIREAELGTGSGSGEALTGSAVGVEGSLDEELDGVSSPAETRTDLKLKIRRLERELAAHTSSSRTDADSGNAALALQVRLDAVSESRLKGSLRDTGIGIENTGGVETELAGSSVPSVQDNNRILSLISQKEALQSELEQLRIASNVNGQTSQSEPDYSVFEEAQKSYESQIHLLRTDLDAARAEATAAEKRYRLEQDLMLSAWHDLGNKVVRDHLSGIAAGAKRSQSKAVPAGWLGRQRRWKEDAIFSR